MKARDLRDRSTEDLAELELSLSGESFQNKFKNFTNRLDDTSVINKSKRDLARVKLILAERARGITVVYKAAEAGPHRPKTRAPVVEVAETSGAPAPAVVTKKTPAKKKPAKTAAKASHPTHTSHAPKAKAKAEPAHKPAAKKTKARTEKSK